MINIKKYNRLLNSNWPLFTLLIVAPLLLINVIKPEWLGRFLAYFIIFHLTLIIILRELFRKDYSKVRIVSGIEKKIVIGVTKFFSLALLLLFLFYGLNYYKDIGYLLKNKKPIEGSGEVINYNASLYSGFGFIGQFLDIKPIDHDDVQDYTLILHSIIKKGLYIKFYYLPNSNLILQIL